jgi:hypothetical protein
MLAVLSYPWLSRHLWHTHPEGWTGLAFVQDRCTRSHLTLQEIYISLKAMYYTRISIPNQAVSNQSGDLSSEWATMAAFTEDFSTASETAFLSPDQAFLFQESQDKRRQVPPYIAQQISDLTAR